MSGWKQQEGVLALLIGIILAVIAFVPLSQFDPIDEERSG
jgi:hypothetical protein